MGAQPLDSSAQFLSDRANADRDLFGQGRADGLSLETQVQKNHAGLQFTMIEDKWIEKDESDRNLVGTEEGAERFFSRTLRGNDLVVVGQVLNQISILNTNKSTIVTDSLIQISDVLTRSRRLILQTAASS